MRYSLLVWDWNGTIMDDMDFTYEIENKMLRDRNMPVIPSKAFYLENFGFPIIDYYVKLGYDFTVYPYEQLAEEFHNIYAEGYRQCPLRAGVRELLTAVQRTGTPQTILSASEQSRLEEQVNYYGIRGCFGELLGLNDTFAHSKIDRARDYIARNGIDKDRVLFIGDTDHDYEAASAVGCPCVLITGGHQGRSVLETCGVPVFDTFDELKNYIDL